MSETSWEPTPVDLIAQALSTEPITHVPEGPYDPLYDRLARRVHDEVFVPLWRAQAAAAGREETLPALDLASLVPRQPTAADPYRAGRKVPGATVYRQQPGHPQDGALVAVAVDRADEVTGTLLAEALSLHWRTRFDTPHREG